MIIIITKIILLVYNHSNNNYNKNGDVDEKDVD